MKVICPRCGQSITANPEWAGTMVKCPKCSKKVAIPEAKTETPAVQPETRPSPPQAKPKAADDFDDEMRLAPAEQRPKMPVTEDELELAPEQPRPKPKTVLDIEPEPGNLSPTKEKSARPRPNPTPEPQNAPRPAAAPRPPRKTSVDPCPNCGAALPPDGMLCVECGYHLVLKRVLQADMRDMGVDSTSGFQRWINQQMSEGESISSMLWLLHAVMLVIAVAFGLIFHPQGWFVVVPLYLLYLGVFYWARATKAYLRWGAIFWNRMLRSHQRRGWKGHKAFISHEREFNDQALGELEGLEEYEVLDLQGTGITDGALRHLQYCAALKYIVVRGTRVTPKGVSRLQLMKPDIYIWA